MAVESVRSVKSSVAKNGVRHPWHRISPGDLDDEVGQCLPAS